MSELTVNGMVIVSSPVGEYDRRLEILTAEAGRITAFARGARKPSSNLVSVSRVFAFGRFELFQGKTSYTLHGARISNYFDELSQDIEKTYYGFYFLELCRFFSRENVEAREMLNLLYQSLRALSLQSLDNRLVRRIFELKMLEINGVCPPVQKIISGEGRFAFAASLSSGAAYALDFVISGSIGKLYTFTLSDDVFKEFSGVVRRLMEMNTDKKFKSLELIEGIENV